MGGEGTFGQLTEFVTRLMSGGTVEIVLLIVLVVIALILFLVALFILFKLLVLLGKGLLWCFRTGGEKAKEHSQAKREAKLAAPPEIATGWDASTTIGMRRAMSEARRLAGEEAVTLAVVAGEGFSDLCRGLEITPPGVGTVGIAAGSQTILIDASQADRKMLSKLARTLPWRRPVDGVVALVDEDGIPAEALARASSFARMTGLRVAMHLVLPGRGGTGAWQIVERQGRSGAAVCSDLANEAVRSWLGGGSRHGLKGLALAQSRELPAALDRALASAPTTSIDISSLCFGGVGLRGAVNQTLARTQPTATPSLSNWLGLLGFGAGAAVAALAIITNLERADDLRNAVSAAEREAAVPWRAEGIDAIPSGPRVRRVAGTALRLESFSDFSFISPLSPAVPGYFAPVKLGAALLEAYVLKPLAAALDAESRRRLRERADLEEWLEDARSVDEWIVAWEGLGEDPTEVDLRKLLVAAFGGNEDDWPVSTDLALLETQVRTPSPANGGLDVDALTALADDNFINSARLWADGQYTNGVLISAARKATLLSVTWREQHEAMRDLRLAVLDPAQEWITADRDLPDHSYEVRVLGGAVGLGMISSATALEAKAAISQIRIKARREVTRFNLTGLGPLMERSSTSGGGITSALGSGVLSMTEPAEKWLQFLDRVANAGFVEFDPEPVPAIAGRITVDPTALAAARERLRQFDQFATNLPRDVPAALANKLLRDLSSELVIGVVKEVERSLLPADTGGIGRDTVQRLSGVARALDQMTEISEWLEARQARDGSRRVLVMRSRVAAGVLEATVDLVREEDPLGVYPDASADPEALLRSFERGRNRFENIYEDFVQPFIEAASYGGGRATLQWQFMQREIERFGRGDTQTTIAGIESMLRAYAEDPIEACKALRPALTGRDDYLSQKLAEIRQGLELACVQRQRSIAEERLVVLYERFTQHVAGRWPYSGNDTGPEISAPALREFVELLDEAREDLSIIGTDFAELLIGSANFWTLGEEGDVGVQFRVAWRTRPSEEINAAHILRVEIDGVEADEDGIYTWRYGTPARVVMRLAKNSPYRFVGVANDLEWTLEPPGNGSFLRILDALEKAAYIIEATVEDAGGNESRVRISVDISDPAGAALFLPEFPSGVSGG